MNYTETNKLIAEFMGWQVKPVDGEYNGNKTRHIHTIDPSGRVVVSCPSTMWGTEEETIQSQIDSLLNESYGRAGKYHKEWNELMPVVEKIEELGYRFEIRWTSTHITALAWDNTLSLSCDTGSSKIEAVYQGVLQFIQWYNQQNPQRNEMPKL